MTLTRLTCAAAIAAASTSSFAAPELGVFRGNSPGGPSKVDEFGQWLGAPATVGTMFEARSTWAEISGESWNLQPWSQWVAAQPGRNISLAVPMLPTDGSTLANCSAGQYDGSWAKLAQNLTAYGLTSAYLRVGPEMDGSWYPWAAPKDSGKESSFAGCFRRVVQVMRQTQPTNAWKFVLNTAMAFGGSKAYLDAVWPGDEYVDVVAIDFYDQSWVANTYPYPSTCDAACRLSRQQTAWNGNAPMLSAIRDFAVAHGKQVALPEWGVGTRPDGRGGGDDPYFIQNVYDFIADPANNVAYHGYWDYPAPDFNAQLSGATSFPDSAALFSKLFAATGSTTSEPANAAPTVSFSSPSDGQTVSGTLSYAVIATDDKGVARVDVFVDSARVQTDLPSPYSGSLDTTSLADGGHVLTATAYDADGLTATSSISVDVLNALADTSPPDTSTTTTTDASAPATSTSSASTVSLDTPQAGTVILRRTTYFFGVTSTTTSALARVDFFVNDKPVCRLSTAPFVCGWRSPSGYSPSGYTVKVSATDVSGNAGTFFRTYRSAK